MKSKNIHVLKTDKPSRLVLDSINNNLFLTTTKSFPSDIMKFKNIYITSDEEIKEGDWYYNERLGKAFQAIRNSGYNVIDTEYKIILTTDQDLIKDGVQAIPDEFLEWFVKNPSCEWIEVRKNPRVNAIVKRYGVKNFNNGYKIIIPKEEPKQETLEEVAERLFPNKMEEYDIFLMGAKWQAERMYSEEEVLKFSEWIVYEVEHYGCPTDENIIKAIKEIKRILRQ